VVGCHRRLRMSIRLGREGEAFRLTMCGPCRARRLGGGVEADPGLVGQVGDSLGPQHRREGAKHAWQAPGRHDRHPVRDDLAPGDLGAVDGHDRHHRHAWVGQDLGGLVGLETTPPAR
jgi:hypothetical protein